MTTKRTEGLADHAGRRTLTRSGGGYCLPQTLTTSAAAVAMARRTGASLPAAGDWLLDREPLETADAAIRPHGELADAAGSAPGSGSPWRGGDGTGEDRRGGR